MATVTVVNKQAAILQHIKTARYEGVTVKELRENYPELGHHGQVSAELTRLHQTGQVARLATKRDGCSVYTRRPGNRVQIPAARTL